MSIDLRDAVARVNRFIEGYGILAQGGNDPEVVYSAWVNQEDEPRRLLISDLRLICEKSVVEHSYDIVKQPGSREVRAACTCGWVSPSYLTAGMAGTAWDRHREEAHADE